MKTSENGGNGIGKLLSLARKEGSRTHLMILLAYEGALRVSELIHIRVRDVDFKGGMISLVPLRRRKTPSQWQVEPNVLDPVEAYIAEMSLPTEAFLFPGRTKKSCTVVSFRCTGGHISKREVQLIFDRVARAAGLKKRGRGIQYLKHARLMAVAEKTNDPGMIQKIGRYGSPVMSARYIEK